MIRPVAVLALSFAASASSHAITCDALKAEIDQKFRTGGVANFSLTVANAAALLPGRVVGTCDNGNSSASTAAREFLRMRLQTPRKQRRDSSDPVRSMVNCAFHRFVNHATGRRFSFG